jgi:hypothetical protein
MSIDGWGYSPMREDPFDEPWESAGCSWAGDRVPDWDAVHARIRGLKVETVELLDQQESWSVYLDFAEDEDEVAMLAGDYWKWFSEDDGYPEDLLNRALRVRAARLIDEGIDDIKQALVAGSRELTVVEAAGRTILIDVDSDRVCAGQPLTTTGMLGLPLWPGSGPPTEEPLPFQDRSLVEFAAPITENTRLVVAEMPDQPDWYRAAAGVDEGTYTLIRWLTAQGNLEPFLIFDPQRLGTQLWIGDSIDPTDVAPGAKYPGEAGIIRTLAESGALQAAGGRLLRDVRLVGV